MHLLRSKPLLSLRSPVFGALDDRRLRRPSELVVVVVVLGRRCRRGHDVVGRSHQFRRSHQLRRIALSISAASFTNDFSRDGGPGVAGQLGQGQVAAILPDTTSSTRYVEFDPPDLKKALQEAGLPARTSLSRTLRAATRPS